MNPRVLSLCLPVVIFGLSGSAALIAQQLPSHLTFTSSGSFANPVLQGSSSAYLIDNDLTNGYEQGFDTTGVPSGIYPVGPAGSAAFQWGTASTSASFPFTSSLAFVPASISGAAPETSFNIATLYYRNGTINSGSGATAIDIGMQLAFPQPSGMSPINVNFTADLINTPNSSDQIASADIVSLRNMSAPVDFTDRSGNRYFLELTFQVDQATIDGTLSSAKEFRVFEGGGGTASLLGRFTTTPVSPVPEPSAAVLLGFAGMLLAYRRKRD